MAENGEKITEIGSNREDAEKKAKLSINEWVNVLSTVAGFTNMGLNEVMRMPVGMFKVITQTINENAKRANKY